MNTKQSKSNLQGSSMANGFANLWAVEMEKCGLELEPTNLKSCIKSNEFSTQFSLILLLEVYQ